jgi:hypothetical protein
LQQLKPDNLVDQRCAPAAEKQQQQQSKLARRGGIHAALIPS